MEINEEKLRQIIHSEICEYIKHKAMINEMARVGLLGEYDIVVYTDDPGFVPHFHIIDKATRGFEFDCCVKLETNEYFNHGGHEDILSRHDRNNLYDFMLQPHRNVHYRNNYEYAVNLWNDNNSSSYVQINEDNNGNIIVPDYRHIQ